MSENQLTFKKFIRLPRAVQNERYRELSDHDKFLARMNDWTNKNPDPDISEDWKPSQEEIERLARIANKQDEE